MRYPKSLPKPAPKALSEHELGIDRERYELLQQWQSWLKMPMLVLSFAWLGLLIVELVWGLNPFLKMLGLTIWVIFILDFCIKFLLAPHKLFYLNHNWLIAFSLIIPALGTLQIVPILQSLQSVHAVRGLQLLGIMTRTNRGMRLLAASMERRGISYVLALTVIVALAGAAGIYTFERKLPNGIVGIADYGTALWWTAMVMTTIGSDYFPKTGEGRVLCFLLAVYAIALCGYATATLATFFVGQDAESDEAELAGAKSIQALQVEIAALRNEIQALAKRDLEH